MIEPKMFTQGKDMSVFKWVSLSGKVGYMMISLIWEFSRMMSIGLKILVTCVRTSREDAQENGCGRGITTRKT